MRVMNLLIGAQGGGAETFFMRFGSAIHKRGVEQLMVMSPYPQREEYFDEHGTPYICIDFESWFGLAGKLRLRKVIADYKPDIIIAWMNRAARRLPKQTDAIKIGRLGGAYQAKNYTLCDYIVVNSEPLRLHSLRQGLKEVTCIANFVEVQNVEAASKPRRRGNARPQLFFHGRLHAQKGLDVLLEAMVDIDADLTLAGSGELEGELRSQAEGLGVASRITHLGWQRDPSTFLRDADVYVFPSRYEGTSNSLLEAMAYGKPIVTTNGDSVSWFLKHEENALIVDVDNAEQLAQAVNRLLTDPALAKRLGDNARALYLQRFNEEAICKQWLKLFQTVKKRSVKGPAKDKRASRSPAKIKGL